MMRSNIKTKIPIQVESYEELFNEFDGNILEKRLLRDDINDFIYEYFKTMAEVDALYLEISLPQRIYDEEKEAAVFKAIPYYYDSKLKFEGKIVNTGIRRIIYYMLMSVILFIAWFYLRKIGGETLLTTALNAGANVLLWQVMTLIFIEGKNFQLNYKLLKRLYHLEIVFTYKRD